MAYGDAVQRHIPSTEVAGRISFIDNEAIESQVRDESEEEDEDDAGFIATSDEEDGDPHDAAGINHRLGLEEEVATTEDFLSLLADKYTQPSRLTASKPTALFDSSEENRLHQQGDWETWEVPVNVGSESRCVYRLYQRCLQGMYAHSIPPRSIFAPIGLIGRIYVEAKRLADVYTLCRGMLGVRWWEGRKIDNIEAMRLLQRPMPSFKPEENGWVRLRKKPYTRDVAVIREVLPQGRLQVVVVPRIHPLPETSSQNQGPAAKKRPKPSAQPVDFPALIELGSRLRIEGTGPFTIYRYRRRVFDSSGYLLLTLKADEYDHVEVTPTVAQVKLFANSASIPISVKLKAFRCAEGRQLHIGDEVVIVASEHAGRVGEVEAVLDTHVYIRLSDPSDSNLYENIQIPHDLARRHFKIGDDVRVKAGSYAGAEHLKLPFIYAEFADLNVQLGSLPRNPNIIRIPEHAYTIYLDLPVVVRKGPLKGRSGVIKSVNSQGEAQVELRGSHHYSNRLQQLNLHALAFEMEICQWFEMKDKHDTTLHRIVGIPDDCSILREVHIGRRSPTPPPDNVVGGPGCFDIWPLGSQDGPEVAPPAIPPHFWLIRLQHRDSFGNLRITVRSDGSFDDGKWDKEVGIYKGLDGVNVSVFFSGRGKILVPYHYALPTYPHKKYDYVFCLSEDQYFGTRYIVWEYGSMECSVTTYQGGNKGKVTRMVSTFELALAS
ncbi:hypothetical protein AGABI1DRAFT_132613 [Agaricus bisporus var. burnettii JB137-S8]|uniref:Chromatin elongation factor SPT5 n=1 Tax=Agaricus bisporus var. burnettii (strain JB137-S8 / ATCC MYA-4627 / FGSC 10392) TaxID=597362 RepID=K5XKR3_AGABU|nr:uncharacterized protein AGABI1DRAFT_132613 [Agaricus bisporus var. burnettii JB137-S8]EKM75075.1 hypothetical protein AGABI1DRAFT_132613 [Agaricus bisporus var. burnettii JB137-S8]